MQLSRLLLLLGLAALGPVYHAQAADDDDVAVGDDDEDDLATEDDEVVEITEAAVTYEPPKDAPGSVFWDGFENLNKWVHTADEDFKGSFSVGKGSSALKGSTDSEMLIPEEAKKYGIVSVLPKGLDFSDADLVFQYEVRYHDEITCSGSYVKLLQKQDAGWEPKKFNDKSRFSVMFGPDKCGSTNKVHVIIQVYNPSSKEWVEHHLENPPSVKTGKDTSLYTLAIRPKKGEYEVFVNMKSEKKGKLADDFDPPFQPPEKIPDPDETKPEDWIDDEKMDDPEAKKPDDWDEDAPYMIPDPEAEKPECWQDDEPREIPDPEAVKPTDWDDEEDGEWEAETVDNKKCTDECGCGEWKRPEISNPDYKGKWYPPRIDNPAYKGEWKPQDIPNKAYYKLDNVKIAPIHAVAVDVWVMNKQIGFDNFYLGHDPDAAWAFAAKTWKIKHAIEEKSRPKTESFSDVGPIQQWFRDMLGDKARFVDPVFVMATENPIRYGLTGLALLLSTVFLCCYGGSDETPSSGEGDSASSSTITDSASTDEKKTEDVKEKEAGKSKEADKDKK